MMNIRSLKPASRREWQMAGLGALAGILAFAAISSRYEYRSMAGGEYSQAAIMRIDRWTGWMTRCVYRCVPVPEGRPTPVTEASVPPTPAPLSPPPAPNVFDQFDKK